MRVLAGDLKSVASEISAECSDDKSVLLAESADLRPACRVEILRRRRAFDGVALNPLAPSSAALGFHHGQEA